MKTLSNWMLVAVAVFAFGCGDDAAKKAEEAKAAAAKTAEAAKKGAEAAKKDVKKAAATAKAEVKKVVGAAKAATATAAAAVAADVDAAKVNAFYTTRCATCHGESGKGDGVAGKALKPVARDFTDAAWQDKTDDAKMKKVILEGGPAIGLSPLMAPAPDLKAKPAMLNAIVKKIRAYKGK